MHQNIFYFLCIVLLIVIFSFVYAIHCHWFTCIYIFTCFHIWAFNLIFHIDFLILVLIHVHQKLNATPFIESTSIKLNSIKTHILSQQSLLLPQNYKISSTSWALAVSVTISCHLLSTISKLIFQTILVATVVTSWYYTPQLHLLCHPLFLHFVVVTISKTWPHLKQKTIVSIHAFSS